MDINNVDVVFLPEHSNGLKRSGQSIGVKAFDGKPLGEQGKDVVRCLLSPLGKEMINKRPDQGWQSNLLEGACLVQGGKMLMEQIQGTGQCMGFGWLDDAMYCHVPGLEQAFQVINMVEERKITGSTGKELLARVEAGGQDPERLVAAEGLGQVSDEGALRQVARQIVQDNPGQVEAHRKGKVTLIGWFVGQVMRQTGGKADPQRTRAVLEEILAAGSDA